MSSGRARTKSTTGTGAVLYLLATLPAERIDLGKLLAVLETIEQQPAARRVLQDALFDVAQTDALHPGRGALQIMRLLAVELDEGAAILQHFLFCGHLAQQIGDPHFDPTVAADMQFVA